MPLSLVRMLTWKLCLWFASILSVWVLVITSAYAAQDPQHQMLREAEQICRATPMANLASVLHQIETSVIGAVGKRAKRSSKTYQYRLAEVRHPHLLSEQVFAGKYFRILQGEDESVVPISCEQIRASNVYYYLNRVHEYFQQQHLSTFPQRLSFYLQQHYPIDVRVDLEASYQFVGKFSDRHQTHNLALTTCGHVEKREKYEFVEKPEILFFKPQWQKGRFAFAPICWLEEFRNDSPCAKVESLDLAMIPANIIHEYVHLLTDPFLDPCRSNILGESYSIFASIALQPLGRVGDFFPAFVSHRHNQAEFVDKFPPYSPKSEELDDLWLEPEASFAYQFMGQVYQRLQQKLKMDRHTALRVVLGSAFELRESNGNQIPRVVDLPEALRRSCLKHWPQAGLDCQSAVTRLQIKHFNL